jgi:membrane associated rhomboid family serine protease
MLVYYSQIQNLYQVIELNNLSLSDPQLILNFMSERDYSNAITAFNSVMVGASGAIYGVLVAFAFSFPNSKLMLLFLPFPIKAKFFVPLLILIDLFFGISSFSVGPIAHFAHVGGAFIGLIMVLYWRKNQFNDRRWD